MYLEKPTLALEELTLAPEELTLAPEELTLALIQQQTRQPALAVLQRQKNQLSV